MCKSKLHFESTSCQSEWLSSITQKTIKTSEDTRENEHFYTVGGNVNKCNCYEKKYGVPPQKIKIKPF
jgi:hypothetical protein